MKIVEIRTLRGPNIWSRHPILEALVDLEELRDSPSDTLPGLYERLTAWLPSLVEHQCSVGERGGFLQRLREGTWPGHILEHVTLELQCLAGTQVKFGKARETSRPGIYRVVARYVDERLGRACFHEALELLLSAIHDRPYNVEQRLVRLRALADAVCLGPSTRTVVEAAEALGIPARRLNDGSLVLLGQGCRQRRIWTSETDLTSAVAESIAQDKDLTRKLLAECGVPVPEGQIVADAQEAWTVAQEIGLPVAVKPRDANQGRGVFLALETREQVELAFSAAADEGSSVMVEKMIPGRGHRLLVVDGKMVAAALTEPAAVVGDGRSTVLELIDRQINGERSLSHGKYRTLDLIDLDPVVRFEVARQGLDVHAVPGPGARVLIQRKGHVVHDVTEQVHPEVADRAQLAARVVGLNIAGIDIVTPDISRPLEEQGGAVVEVNAGPSLYTHARPATGKVQPVGEAIVKGLLPAGDSGRIPLACIMGTNGRTVVARMLACMLLKARRHVGLACGEGIFHDGILARPGDRSDAPSARDVLLDPAVDAAVIEASPQGILKEGLGFDRCDVAVVTGLTEDDHVGSGYAESSEELFTIQRCGVDVVLPSGTAVLNADDPLVVRMEPLCAGDVVFFSRNPEQEHLRKHLRGGRKAVLVQDGHIGLVRGHDRTDLAALAALPQGPGGEPLVPLESSLAAAAAAWVMGLPPEIIGGVVLSFGADKTGLVSSRSWSK
jgi:cyanophycin synthetase